MDDGRTNISENSGGGGGEMTEKSSVELYVNSENQIESFVADVFLSGFAKEIARQ